MSFLGSSVILLCPFSTLGGQTSLTVFSTYSVAPSVAWGREETSHAAEATFLILGKGRGALSLGRARGAWKGRDSEMSQVRGSPGTGSVDSQAPPGMTQ